MGGILRIMRVSSQEARNGQQSGKELPSGQRAKPLLHPITRFAAYLIPKFTIRLQPASILTSPFSQLTS